jgi:dipeptidyl aminopeptidase/acylaminoacyl peptidase
MPRKRTLSIDDLFRVKSFLSIRLSPDGRHAVVCVRSVDRKERMNVSRLWLYRREDDSFEQVTSGQADGDARWLDLETFVFPASKRQKDEEESDKPFGRTRLYSMSVRGGEPRLRATLDGKVWDMAVSPDGRRLALAYSPNRQAGPEQHREWAKTPPPIVPSHLHWKLDGTGPLAEEHPRVYLMDLGGQRWAEQKVLPNSPRLWHGAVQWLSEGRLMFLRHDADRKDVSVDIVVSDLKGAMRVLPAPEGPKTGVGCSPDGRLLVFTGNDDPRRGGYLPAFLYLRSTDSADRSCEILARTDGRMGGQLTLSDVFSTGPSDFKWQDGTHVVGLHSVRGRTELLRVEVGSGRSEVLAGGSGTVQTFDAAADTVLYAWGDFTSVGELYRLGRRRPVSRLNAPVSRLFDIAPQRWQVRSERGVRVDTFLWATPAQMAARRRSLPLVVYVHGGPVLQIGEGAFHEYAWLAHEGYAVLACNPRGSGGYGAKHGLAAFGNWGDRDAHDILAVRRDALRRYPQFDPKRTFIVGGSYGGYMTNWMLTRHPRVFRAGIAQRSISNHMSFAGTSDFSTHFTVGALGIENIWQDPVRAWERSPLARVAQVRAPLLLTHADNDLRCPVGQAEEMFVALVEMGKKVNEDVRFVLFRGESHGLSRGGKPDNRRARLQEILAWLKKHDAPCTRRAP